MTLCVGPAGTGKTYLAVAAAVAAFRDKAVNRIILTRPAVEAGEKLGFLPGDLQNKVDPISGRCTTPCSRCSGRLLSQIPRAGQHRGRPLVYARQDPGRPSSPGRGAEHLAGADEDVSDPLGFGSRS